MKTPSKNKPLPELLKTFGEINHAFDHVSREVRQVRKSRENDPFSAVLLPPGSLIFRGTESRCGGEGGRRVNAGDFTSRPAALIPGGDVPVYGLGVEWRGEKKYRNISPALLQATSKGTCPFSHPEAAEAVKGRIKGSAVTAEQFLDGFLLLR